ncbi:MAG: hypothetical protein IPM98_21815 [Lewinellaceae bacterium]|nr:hypothetical protein [Lewinellaceae bacterium]
MKKRLQVLTLVFLMGVSFQAIAAPCYTTFSYQASIAAAQYTQQWVDCTGIILSGPCKTEATARYNQEMFNITASWNQCCCTNGLSCCGN